MIRKTPQIVQWVQQILCYGPQLTLSNYLRRNHRTFLTQLAKPKSKYKAIGLKIQIWVKHNRTLITQTPVSVFQIYPKN